MAEIARRVGTTEDRVALRLRRYGIPLRRARAEPLEAGLLEELYRDQGLAVGDLAGRLGCSIAHVRRELRRHGIQPPRRSATLPPAERCGGVAGALRARRRAVEAHPAAGLRARAAPG